MQANGPQVRKERPAEAGLECYQTALQARTRPSLLAIIGQLDVTAPEVGANSVFAGRLIATALFTRD